MIKHAGSHMEECDKASPPSRFLVRQGCKGWMVYDRQRKGPAMIGTSLAVDLTKEQANRIERMLMAEQEGKRSS
ncbi:hypothetical protein ACH79_42825 [Bradyrhizobium sp. CCBAU 051011]|nr:hypothetical protein ACH79_42825 [Bradyrhizobium sp. CCBAU 051011]